ncbi:anthranilate phosphoribosyltransferase [Halorhodospira neutriphila]|uniref:Anthranilate phosphoribosyltransferase n=1 Tax=Halorhodospira neutriphila TaxID=168379 RepID=A0ABS1E4P2_9GAMM|nr:anthranilate phosphoribosyltransferase [Halorhodospira neutriphila]MBK1726711.1 anthranilate phosphoribosyltransferase [Halorhodospira neutriphila]
MEMQEAIRRLSARGDLQPEEMAEVMRTIMTGGATPAQIGGFLIGLGLKGETVGEIAAAAGVMRELAERVEADDVASLVDTCGTGGDASGTLNVSTAAAFVAAAGGAPVAKHGNRSVSSRSGSADLLEACGASLALDSAGVGECLRRCGVGFLFAPQHHGAMRHAVGPRRELGVRTLFNLLGPLTNPAGAQRQLLGVFDARWVRPVAEVLRELGSVHVLVVHAEDGLDEISIAAPTRVAELRGGEVREYTLTPAELGLAEAPLSAVTVASAEDSLALIRAAFAGEPTPAAELIAANAGAALYVADRAASLREGVERARELMASGAAAEALERFAATSRELAG